MEIFAKLGIEPQLLIAQGINFLLLLFVLYRFLYKPVLKMLNERTEKIEKGMKDAEEVEQRLQACDIERTKILENAKKEADDLAKKTKSDNEELRKLIIADAEKKSVEIVKKAKKSLEKERGVMMNGIKKEIAGLVDASLQVIIEDNKDKIDKKLVDETITNLAAKED